MGQRVVSSELSTGYPGFGISTSTSTISEAMMSEVVFGYERLASADDVRRQIRECEGRHVQQAIFSTFMDTLTQVCFTCQMVRSSIEWNGNVSWTPMRMVDG